MSLIRAPHLPILQDERGYTLIELLVSIVTGIVVVGALFSILEVSLRQNSQIADKTQANQLGRTVLTNILDELHSSCTGLGTAAIQAPSSGSTLGTPTSPLGESNATNLWFISAYGSSESAKAVIAKATLHDINWTRTGTSSTSPKYELGTLTDYTFSSTSGSAPNWVFPTLTTANAKSRLLGTNIIPATISSEPTVFQYYGYEHNIKEASQPGYGAINETPLTTPLSASEASVNYAANVAKANVTFSQAPTNADTRTGRVANLSGSVVFRFSPATSGVGSVNNPCP